MIVSCENRVFVEGLVQVRRIIPSRGVSRLYLYPPSGAYIRMRQLKVESLYEIGRETVDASDLFPLIIRSRQQLDGT